MRAFYLSTVGKVWQMALGSHSSAAANKPPEQIVMRPPRIGVVAFNSTTVPTSGSACVAGEGIPLRDFERRNEIASDVIWISNAKDAVNAQNFRSGNYFRSSLKAISEDLGVTLVGDGTIDGLRTVADTIGRARDIFAHAYAWRDFSEDWSHRDASSCISRLLLPTGEILQNMESPLRQAYQSFSTVPDRGFPDGQAQGIFSLRANRLRYAQFICSTRVPNGAWLASNVQSSNLDQYLDPDRPCLVEVSLEFSTSLNDKVTPALTAFGSSSSAMGRAPIRKWVSQIELAWLVEHANVHVSSAFFCEVPGTPLAEVHQLPTALTVDPIYALSVAAGLIAECHWVALSSLTSVKRAGGSATQRYVDLASPTAVWLRAADRAYCFEMAKIVAKRGYMVTSYGYGAVTFWGPKNNIQEIMDLSDQLGTCHPCLGAMMERNLIGQDVSSMEGVL